MRRSRNPLVRSLLVLGLAAAPGAAQDFNLDFGGSTGNTLPVSTFGAGAGRPGVWSALPPTPGVQHPLTNTAGAATFVTAELSGGVPGVALDNLVGATPDDVSLMSDYLDPVSGSAGWTIRGLAAGTYDVYTYAMAPDDGSFRTRVNVSGSIHPAQDVGGAWPNGYVQGITHAKHRITIAAGALVIVAIALSPSPPAPATNYASANGFQIVRVTANGASFCTGDGFDATHTTACPCGNAGSPGNGCANSVNASGANLSTAGATASNDVVLAGTGMPASVSCIFLQGDALADLVFGDGVRCAGGALVRLRVRANVGGASSFPDSTDTTTLSTRGGVTPGSGATRYYQIYYRNSAASFCPPETFNVTNGWITTW